MKVCSFIVSWANSVGVIPDGLTLTNELWGDRALCSPNQHRVFYGLFDVGSCMLYVAVRKPVVSVTPDGHSRRDVVPTSVLGGGCFSWWFARPMYAE